MTSTASAEAVLTIQEVSRRTGLSGPTLRYYEQIGLIPPVPRDPTSGHRRFGPSAVTILEALACLRGAGVPIEEMRRYLTLLKPGDLDSARGQADLFDTHAARVQTEIARLTAQLEYLRAKSALWHARVEGDTAAEDAAMTRSLAAIQNLGVGSTDVDQSE